jgi:hypothetical protein
MTSASDKSGKTSTRKSAASKAKDEASSAPTEATAQPTPGDATPGGDSANDAGQTPARPDEDATKSSATASLAQGGDDDMKGEQSSAKSDADATEDKRPLAGAVDLGDNGTNADGTYAAQNAALGNSGAGTGIEAAPESTTRMPAGAVVVNEGVVQEVPQDAALQRTPEGGYSLSSTDPVYAEAFGRTIAGEDYVGLVDSEGNALGPDDLFDESDQSKSFVVTKARIVEEFYYPNTTVKAKRLVFAEGKRVPRVMADRMKAAIASAPKPAVEQG